MHGDSSSFCLIILIIALLISIWVACANSQRADRENKESRRKGIELSQLREEHATALAAKNVEYAKLAERMQSLVKIVEQRKVQFPWLASAIADFHALEAERAAQAL